MGEFHFLRPAWLLALPLGLVWMLLLARAHSGGGGWRRVVDAPLQPFVLTSPAALAGRQWLLAAALGAWTLATLALAGPTWQKLPVPAFRSSESLVVALDLSRSMDAADLPPSRLARAKLKVLSLLERRDGGQTGLVVFSAHAFAVTPLTTDVRTIGALVSALSTDIMPSRGSYLEAGLDKAASLLRQSGVSGGDILLISDAQPSPRALELARDLAAEGMTVNVLGVGTKDGAPVPEQDGGFMTDAAGRVVVPTLDAAGLRRLAAAGDGRFAVLSNDDSDLDILLAEDVGDPVADEIADVDREADVWRDAGTWIAALLLPLVALGFRRGWIAAVLVCLCLPAPWAFAQMPDTSAPAASSAPADAGGESAGFSVGELWQSLWQRPDQRGADAFAGENPERAARLFEDSNWRAAAQYRSGRYADSAATLAGAETDDALYNRGNALARTGQLDAAIAAYDRALELNAEHEDARYNRELVARLRDEQQSESEQQQGQQPQQSGAESEDASSDGDDAQNGESQSGQQGEQQSQEAAADEQSADDDGSSGSNDVSAADDAEDLAQDSSQQPGEQEPSDAEQSEQANAGAEPTPQELERWASEQAAEQWLRRIPQDPGGLLRRKFLYQYQRLGIDQDGNYVWPGDEAEPW